MNQATLIGWITKMKQVNRYGVAITLKTCEPGYTMKNGKEVAPIVTYHTCLANGYMKDYIVKNFHEGNLVVMNAKICNKLYTTPHEDNVMVTYFKITSLNLYILTNITPSTTGSSNYKTIGDEAPNFDEMFEEDF